MYAVIEISGKQQIVKKDEIIKVDRLNAEKGESVTVNRVLALGEGENMTFGTPLVKGASVIFEVLENRKDKKGHCVQKRKEESATKSKRGHRQYLSVVKVKEIINS